MKGRDFVKTKEKIQLFHVQLLLKRLSSTTVFLNALMQREKNRKASSKQIAEGLIGIDSTTVRRDFSYFDELGRRGFG